MFNSLKSKLKSWFKKAEPEKEKPKTKKIKAKAPKPKLPKKAEKAIKKAKEKKIKQEAKKEEIIPEPKITSKEPKHAKGERFALDKSKISSKSESRIGWVGTKEDAEPALQQKPTPEPEEKSSFFDRFKTKLTEDKFEELFHELEMILLQNNVALEVVEKIKTDFKEQLIGKNLSDINLEERLRKSLEQILINPPDFIKEIKTSLTQKQPFIILLAGINGSGKTTTTAKLVHLLKKEKFTCCLAAADTFRAASIEQLQEHADKLKVHVIKKDYGADPASVGFDAIAYAKKHHMDIVLIDTAGRMQNKDSLMQEIEKIARVTKPDMKIFVGESITGNDATEQAKAFNNSIDLTGIILSKADVDEKGGTALSVSYVTKKPILFLGTGQTYNDLERFNKGRVIKSLGL